MFKKMPPHIQAQYYTIRREMEQQIAGTYSKIHAALRPLGYDRETIQMVADREELKIHRAGWDQISKQFEGYDY